MAFQGKEFTPEMRHLVVKLKLHFDKEKKAGKSVPTRNATERGVQYKKVTFQNRPFFTQIL